MISNRIFENSCDKNHFYKTALDYNIALKDSKFNDNATYIPSPSKRKTHKWQIICFNSQYCANMKTKIYKIFMRLLNQHFSRHHKYYKLFNRKKIKLIYSFMPNMNNVIRKHNSKIVKNRTPCTIKTCNCCQKTDCPWMVTIFLNALLTKYLLIQLLINITLVLVKTLSKNVRISINPLLEINLVIKTLNCPSMYRNWKREILIILLIWVLLWNSRNMFGNHENVIYAIVRRSSFLGQILMFCSINVMMMFSPNVDIEIILFSVCNYTVYNLLIIHPR